MLSVITFYASSDFPLCKTKRLLATQTYNIIFYLNNKLLNLVLKFYGFSQNYIKIHKADCIKAVKRSLNYKTIDSSISKNFKNKLNNLLFK